LGCDKQTIINMLSSLSSAWNFAMRRLIQIGLEAEKQRRK
jgi:hypothetical protein